MLDFNTPNIYLRRKTQNSGKYRFVVFIDQVWVKISAGRGGNGIVAWKRAKYLPKGGPSGGDGGSGGSVFIRASKDISSLEHLRYTRILQAENGADGQADRKKGKNGKKLVILVPMGTLVKSSSSEEILYDLTHDGETIELCRGGRGGRGNHFFKTATNRAPRKATNGKNGEELECELELKIIADVGFVGLPNAGKSTLLSAFSQTTVKTGAYPFTTLKPNLRVISHAKQKIVIADIPGIIEGAHKNKGLGFLFLRHIERTKMLVYVIDGSRNEDHDPCHDFMILRRELQQYNPELLHKPFLVVLNKNDVDDFIPVQEFIHQFRLKEEQVFSISAELEDGTDDVLQCLCKAFFPKPLYCSTNL